MMNDQQGCKRRPHHISACINQANEQPSSPHVNGCRVVVAAEQQLRCAVPARDHVLCHAHLVLSTEQATQQQDRNTRRILRVQRRETCIRGGGAASGVASGTQAEVAWEL